MTSTKLAAAVLALGFIALPLATADAASRNARRPVAQPTQVVEGRNAATGFFDQSAANNGATAILLQEQGNARADHGR